MAYHSLKHVSKAKNFAAFYEILFNLSYFVNFLNSKFIDLAFCQFLSMINLTNTIIFISDTTLTSTSNIAYHALLVKKKTLMREMTWYGGIREIVLYFKADL